jgi:hypothetical protein
MAPALMMNEETDRFGHARTASKPGRAGKRQAEMIALNAGRANRSFR